MSARKVAPYGSWPSPVTLDLLFKRGVQFRYQMIRYDGEELYWSELRPDEGGRVVVCRRAAGGTTHDVTPPGFNARTRVHEYGGGHFAASRGTVWFTNFVDQRLYKQARGETPRAITPAADVRHADMAVDDRRGRVIAVREDHTTGAREPINSLVSIDANGGDEVITIAAGNDFYSSPRLSPDGNRIAWMTWNHPNMPWDGCELWVGELNRGGQITSSKKMAGGETESILQPEWSPSGELYFISDRSNWWNLYRARGEGDQPVCPRAAEFGAPHWSFGMRFYAFAGPDEIVCLYFERSAGKLGRIDLNTGSMRQVELIYTSLTSLQTDGTKRAALFAGAPAMAERLLTIDLETGAQEVVKVANSAHIDPANMSLARPIEFPTQGGATAHAIYYSPQNQQYEGPPEEKPPLMVRCHGGPTSSAGPTYTFEYQYWTSRGFAVVDVNYGGSSGYGREYRMRLNGNWGVVDVDDCINAARFLVEEGLADGNRVWITGGSAGGFTALLSLTKRDFYNAGASHYGIGDLELFVNETHKFEAHYMDRLVGPYPERADLYRDRSAINFADNLNRPVILFQGLEDKVVPPSQAEEFVAVCKKKKLPYAYVAFEGEQHGFRQEKNIRRSIDGELYFVSQIFAIATADPIEPVTIENFKRPLAYRFDR